MLLLVLFFLAVDGLVKEPIRSRKIFTNQGDDLELFCNGADIKWLHYPQLQIQERVIYDNGTLLDQRYIVINNTNTLILPNMNVADKGDYLCVNATDVLDFYSVYVVVDTQYVDLRAGETFNMTCFSAFSAFKTDQVTLWHLRELSSRRNRYNIIMYNAFIDNFYYSSNANLTMHQSNSTYQISIPNVTVCDSGVYSCNIINSDPSVDMYHLMVTGDGNLTRSCQYRRIPHTRGIIKRRYRQRKTKKEIHWVRYLKELYSG
jgi:Immunoglobulin V-set domain